MGRRPRRVFPIITHLSEFRVDPYTFKGYIEPLMQRAGLYSDEFWEIPQWLQVQDLEMLVSLVEKEGVNFAELLQEKIKSSKGERFDLFLFERFGQGQNLFDERLFEKGLELHKSAGVSFFPDHFDQQNNENPDDG